jgi:hypothetical protein
MTSLSLALVASALGAYVTAGAAPDPIARQEGRVPVKVAVLPILNTCEPRFPNSDKAAVREAMNRLVCEWLAKQLEGAGYSQILSDAAAEAIRAGKVDMAKADRRNAETLHKLGRELGAGLVVFIWIEGSKQENAEIGAILGSAGKAGSESRVTARVWLADVPSSKLVLDGAKLRLEGVSKGPFFGTTRRREMSGNPQDVAYVIMEENRKRAEWLAKAAIEAVRKGLGGVLGFKGDA